MGSKILKALFDVVRGGLDSDVFKSEDGGEPSDEDKAGKAEAALTEVVERAGKLLEGIKGGDDPGKHASEVKALAQMLAGLVAAYPSPEDGEDEAGDEEAVDDEDKSADESDDDDGSDRADKQTPGAGVGGICVCPKCGAEIEHEAGLPCASIECPKCGGKMQRKTEKTEKSAADPWFDIENRQ